MLSVLVQFASALHSGPSKVARFSSVQLGELLQPSPPWPLQFVSFWIVRSCRSDSRLALLIFQSPFRMYGRRTLLEQYSDVKANPALSTTLFEPSRWSTAPHWRPGAR